MTSILTALMNADSPRLSVYRKDSVNVIDALMNAVENAFARICRGKLILFVEVEVAMENILDGMVVALSDNSRTLSGDVEVDFVVAVHVKLTTAGKLS